MRKQIAAANWKMNLTLEQGKTLTAAILQATLTTNIDHQVILGVPFPYLIMVKEQIGNHENVFAAAQNCYSKPSGAYTGEVSVEMLKSIGIQHVIIGHSERREYFNESHAMLADKINICLEFGLTPIFCCGEPLAIREAGTQNSYVATQLEESLFHLSPQQLTGFIIAYEPIWAIGTGKTATNEQAQEIQAYIRQVIAAKYDSIVADSISILYGGSVKAGNAKEIFAQPDVDGGLVGGASLVATDFVTIINSLK